MSNSDEVLRRYRERLAQERERMIEPEETGYVDWFLELLDEEERRGLCWAANGKRHCRREENHEEATHDDGSVAWATEEPAQFIPREQVREIAARVVKRDAELLERLKESEERDEERRDKGLCFDRIAGIGYCELEFHHSGEHRKGRVTWDGTSATLTLSIDDPAESWPRYNHKACDSALRENRLKDACPGCRDHLNRRQEETGECGHTTPSLLAGAPFVCTRRPGHEPPHGDEMGVTWASSRDGATLWRKGPTWTGGVYANNFVANPTPPPASSELLPVPEPPLEAHHAEPTALCDAQRQDFAGTGPFGPGATYRCMLPAGHSDSSHRGLNGYTWAAYDAAERLTAKTAELETQGSPDKALQHLRNFNRHPDQVRALAEGYDLMGAPKLAAKTRQGLDETLCNEFYGLVKGQRIYCVLATGHPDRHEADCSGGRLIWGGTNDA